MTISPEDLERERMTLLAMKDSGYTAPGGGIDRALSVIARIDKLVARVEELEGVLRDSRTLWHVFFDKYPDGRVQAHLAAIDRVLEGTE